MKMIVTLPLLSTSPVRLLALTFPHDKPLEDVPKIHEIWARRMSVTVYVKNDNNRNIWPIYRSLSRD